MILLEEKTELLIGAGLIAALMAAIFSGMNELAMSIAGGLVGYMGRGKLQEKKEQEGKEDAK